MLLAVVTATDSLTVLTTTYMGLWAAFLSNYAASFQHRLAINILRE